MATKVLDILVRAKDNATGPLKQVSDAAKKSGTSFTELGDSLKGIRQGGLNQSIEELGKFAKGAAVIGTATFALSSVTTAIKGYREALAESNSANLAFTAGVEGFVGAIPVLSTVVDFFRTLAGVRDTAAILKDTQALRQQVQAVNELVAAYRQGNIQLAALKPGTSDDAKADAAIAARAAQRDNDYNTKAVELLKQKAKLEREVKNAGDFSERSDKTAQLSQVNQQLDFLSANNDTAKATDDAERAEVRRKSLERQGDDAVAAELRIARVSAETRKAVMAEFGSSLQAELDMLRDQLAEKVRLIEEGAKKESRGKDKPERDAIAARAAKEIAAERAKAGASGDVLEHRDANRQAEAKVQAELRIARASGEIRAGLLASYGLQLQSELSLLATNTNEKIRLIELAATKEKEGKSQAERAAIDARAGADVNAVKVSAQGQSGASYRADLLRQREQNQRQTDQSQATRSALQNILIDGMQREADLGGASAKLEVERLKIAEETVAKRKQLTDIITNENTSLADRAKATAGLFALNTQQQLKLDAVGATNFVGSTAGASTSYFGSGESQASRERQMINPLLAKQTEANETLKQMLAGINAIPDVFKAAKNIIIGKLN